MMNSTRPIPTPAVIPAKAVARFIPLRART